MTDELAEAEDSLRHQSERDRESLVIDRDELRVLLAEYDRRGDSRARWRDGAIRLAAEAEQLRELLAASQARVAELELARA